MPASRPHASSLALASTLAALACSGTGPRSAAVPAVQVSIAPRAAQVTPGGTVAFGATVVGSADGAVLWSVADPDGGTIDAAGGYRAPQSSGTYHVMAASHADPSSRDIATVTVTDTSGPVAVAVAPAAVTLAAGASTQFTATVANTSDAAVTWSVQEGPAGGTVSAAGLYGAPATSGTYHVLATSHADVTKTGQATVTVTAAPGGSAGPCQPLALEAGVSLSRYVTDRYTWSDATCQPRSAALVRNDAADPGGSNGGYLRAFTYVADGVTRNIGAQPFTGWNGWGYVVNHYGSGTSAALSSRVTGTWRTVFAGAYHAVHEFKMRLSPGGPIDVTVHWVFATGRSSPLFAITHDATPAGPDVVAADARAPYGNLVFDGVDGDVAGIGWGDAYRFALTSAAPLTMSSTWDYTRPNEIPYTVMWSAATDAEMGEVQTQTWTDHLAGADYGGGQTAACQGRTSAAPGSCALWPGGSLVANYLWPFQLNNWELQFTPVPTTSKRMAWGQTIGSVGQRSVKAFGRTVSGYPYQSYSVFMVLGKHSDAPTDGVVAEMTASHGTALTATTGSVVTSGRGGAGRTDPVTFSPAGWDHVYAAWTLQAASNRLVARFAVPAGAHLPQPLVRILGWSGTAPPSRVTLGGTALVAGRDYLASVDGTEGAVWMTIAASLSGTVDLTVE